MDVSNILAFIVVATLLVISPGPNGLLITKTVPIFGKKSGFMNIGGFVAAFYVHGTLSIFGISILLVQSAQAFLVFKLLGAAYLFWIGIKSIISAFSVKVVNSDQPLKTEKRTMSVKRAFIEGFLTNVLNPKVSIFYLAAFPQFISVNESPVTAYALVTAHSLVNFIWFALMVFMLSRVKSVADNAVFRKWLSSVTGVVFIGFASKLALMKNS